MIATCVKPFSITVSGNPEEQFGSAGIYNGLAGGSAHGGFSKPPLCSLVVVLIYAHNVTATPLIASCTSNFVTPMTLAGSAFSFQDGVHQSSYVFWLPAASFFANFQAVFSQTSDWVAFAVPYKNALSVGAVISASGDTTPGTIVTPVGALTTSFFGLAGFLDVLQLPIPSTHFEVFGNSGAFCSRPAGTTTNYGFAGGPLPWLMTAFPIA